MNAKAVVTTILFIILSISSYGQITFERGYFIDNFGEKTDCLIKNVDWLNNPTQFDYKLSESSYKQRLFIDSVREFGIYNGSKYQRYVVEIDKSGDDIADMSHQRNPEFRKKQLFLKVLMEGKANLYLYRNHNLKRFFYNVDSTEVKQLVFKSYLNDNDEVRKNNYYQQQLLHNLKCQDISISQLENTGYNKRDLIKVFTKYNQCHHAAFVNLEKKQKRDFIDLAIKFGLNSSTLSIQNTLSGFEANFDRELTFRGGLETEIILPFNKDKWSILVEPTFQYFKTEVDQFYNDGTVSGKTINLTVNYSSIEFPVGIRYSSFFNSKSKLFLDALYVVDAPLGNSIYGNDGDFIDLQITTVRNNFALGIGFEYNNKYSIEFRHAIKRDVLSKYYIWHSEYQSSSLIFGYTIF